LTVTTNATRVLDRLKAVYAVGEFAAAEFTAEEAAEKLGVPPETVFKTLVLRGDRSGLLAAVVATSARLSTKKLARVSANRTVAMVAVDEMEKATGYVKGGCSPFGMRKAMPLFADSSIAGLPKIYCSAGRRGVQLVMTGDEFLAASGATAADLVED
jgi:Cys-tRNA(Pro)/Cys-tRNA(Cys) deacylase